MGKMGLARLWRGGSSQKNGNKVCALCICNSQRACVCLGMGGGGTVKEIDRFQPCTCHSTTVMHELAATWYAHDSSCDLGLEKKAKIHVSAKTQRKNNLVVK
jgi:hypothetical protein